MADIKDKIRKLIAHEKSARAIGNRAEADAYKRHVNTLLRRHNLTRKALDAKPAPQPTAELRGKVNGSWRCSCGFEVTLNLDAPAGFVNMFVGGVLGPHMGEGHKLVRL